MLAQALAACDPSGIDELLDVLPEAESCTTPEGLVQAARDPPVVSPDMRPMVEMRAATDAPGAWMAVCTGGTEGLRILDKMVEFPRDQQRDQPRSGCDLGRLGWFTRDEWRTADGAIVVAQAGAHQAADDGIEVHKVRVPARALAGIGGEAGTRPQPFEDAFITPPDLPMLERPDDGLGDGAGDVDHDGAAFRKRVEPTWSHKAQKEGGRCTVRVFVSNQGEPRNLAFVDRPKPLQKDVERAVEASALEPLRRDGAKVAGRFTATYRVD